MKPILMSAWLCAVVVAAPVWAQTHDAHGQNTLASTPQTAPPTAPDTRATVVPALKPASSQLGRYQAYTDPKISSWVESNAQVARKGGWRAYAREAEQTEGGSPPPADAASGPQGAGGKPAMPHGGHSH